MTDKMRLLPLLLALILPAATASAAVTFALTSSTQNAAAGTELTFTGTLTNTSTADKVFLNDLVITLNAGSEPLAPDRHAFFSNVPGILLPGESYTGVVFRGKLGDTAPAGDFTGSVMVKGGADITGDAPMASAPFTVLSPDVSIVATDSDASEFGPDPGEFTITRTGGTGIALAVPFGIAGSAANGIHFIAIPAEVTIPAGSSSAVLPIMPKTDAIAQGDRTVALTLAPSDDFNPGSPDTASVVIHDLPADQWRFEKFGAAANTPEAADDGDWEHDGTRNLVEYALLLDPLLADSGALPQPFIAGGYLQISYVPNPLAPDISYLVEGTDSLASAWSTSDVEPVTVTNPVPPERLTFRFHLPLTHTDHGFLRLRVVRQTAP